MESATINYLLLEKSFIFNVRKDGLDLKMDSGINKIETFAMFGNKVLILTPHQIITGVEPNAADQWIEALKSRQYSSGTYGEVIVIDISSVTEIETKEEGRLVGVSFEQGEELTYEALIMKDVNTKDAFFERLHSYLPQEDYTSTTERYSSLKAIGFPLAVLGIVLVVGAFSYWFANLLETQGGPKSRVRVQVWVAVFYYIVSWLGPMGVMVVTGLGALASIAWMAKRMTNPPVKTVVAKKN